jgi:serine/threonine protein phosphatase 1
MVLKKLLALGGGKAVPRHLPAGRRIYAIGDVHGRLDLLEDLLARIEQDDRARAPADSAVLFLGDLIDRGPDSNGVVERVLGLSERGYVAAVLMGNHEEVLLNALEGDTKAARLFTRIGGRETLLSYGVLASAYDEAGIADIPDLIAKFVPEHHLRFIRGFADFHREGDYLFVHAGVRPRVAFEEQAIQDLRWIRGEFLTHRGDHGAMVIHGHSIAQEVDERSNRIGIDTGAYSTGRLTAIGIENDQRWFLTSVVEPAERGAFEEAEENIC